MRDSGLSATLTIPEVYRDTEGKVYETIYEFPNRGNPKVLYIARSENAIYRWDEKLGKYFCIGRDYTEINNIDGGKA